jgi:hypothetical protein
MDSLPRSETGRFPSPAYVVVGYRLRGCTRFSSSHRNKRGQRSYQNDCSKKLRRNMSHLRLLFHLISRLYERTSIRPVRQGFKRAANPALDPWRASPFSRPSG